MSETKQNMSENQRTPYVLDAEPMDFAADAEVKILTSNEFCRLVNEYFKAGFADYEGCFFDMSNNMPSITLVFNHVKHDENKVYAVDMVDNKKAGNTVIERSRMYDRLVREGDRYHITEDGIDIIKPLLIPRLFNNGKPNWGNIVADYVDRAPANYYMPQGGVQLTRIIGIDPKQICRILFGKKEGDSWLDYGVDVKGNLATSNSFGGNFAPNYVLNITKAYNEHIKKTYEKLGFGTAGSNIVR